MRVSVIAAVLTASLLVACGGGGSSTSVVPQTPTQPTQSGKGKAALSLFVPYASGAATTKRRDLPATTQSVEIIVSNGDGTANSQTATPTIANIAAGAPGCSTSGSGISCNVTVTSPFGAVLFTIVAYNAPNATGNPIAFGYVYATISPGASNAITVTTSSVFSYEVMDSSGGFSSASIDHSAMTLTVTDQSNGSTFTASLVYTANNEYLQGTVTSSTGTNSSPAVGDIVYIRELPGSALTFFSTNSPAPGATGGVGSGADFGIGVAVTACPTQSATVEVSNAAIAGPAFSSNPTGSVGFLNGTFTQTVSGGTVSATFNGTGYNLLGSTVQTLSGGTDTCSGDYFAVANGGSVALSSTGVVIASNGTKPGSNTSSTFDGSAGFVVTGATSPNLSAIESATFFGFVGAWGSTTSVGGGPVNLVGNGTSTLTACTYSNFTAGTVSTTGCLTVTLGAPAAEPGVILVSGGSPTSSTPTPGAVVIGQVNGKYVIFGLIGSTNFAFFQE